MLRMLPRAWLASNKKPFKQFKKPAGHGNTPILQVMYVGFQTEYLQFEDIWTDNLPRA